MDLAFPVTPSELRAWAARRGVGTALSLSTHQLNPGNREWVIAGKLRTIGDLLASKDPEAYSLQRRAANLLLAMAEETKSVADAARGLTGPLLDFHARVAAIHAESAPGLLPYRVPMELQLIE